METASRSSPYKGDRPYIFISYAHKNSDEALAIIHTLQVRGYRVWYDEGIDPGAEWDENIAAHVRKCYLFIALISEADLAGTLSKTLKMLDTSEWVTGVVTEVSPTGVVVDIGTAHKAFIPVDQWSFDPTASPASQVKAGDRVTAAVVQVDDVDGVAVLSRKAVEKENAWASIVKAERDQIILDGIITEVNSYGVVASIGGVRVFVPASQSGKPRGSDLSDMVRTRVQLRITEVDRARRRVVGSIRAAAAEQRAAAAAEVWANIEIGKHYRGTVKSLAAYGAFVDIGGVDGIVHISELSWSRIKDPAEVVSVGDRVDVYVISFDPEKKRISLSMKDRTQEPWAVFLSKYSVGDVVTVRIVKLMTHGVFAEIIPGVDGLIHISQLSDHQVEKSGDVISEGDTADAKIIAIDNENKRVSLSIRALLETPRSRSE